MIKVKSEMRGLLNKPGLIHESRIRETDGRVLFKSRVNSADDEKLAETIASTYELTGKNPDEMNRLVKKKLSSRINEEKKEIKNFMDKQREEDRNLLKRYFNE